MDYISLDNYRYAWFFKHKELHVDQSELDKIKPLDLKSAATLWQNQISKNAHNPDQFSKDDWAANPQFWRHTDTWQSCWESTDSALPEIIEQNIHWEGNSVVYFCYHDANIIETTWDVFIKHWKNFLFLDDGPLLIGKRRCEVVQFKQDGSFALGTKA